MSKFTHDFQRCPCGKVFADGGKEYLRRGWTDWEPVECSWVECPSCKGDGCGECSEGVVSVETWARLVEVER